RAYWYPVYAFLRRSARPGEDAQDLTQAFFTHLLEKNVLAAVDPSRGKFRTFLLTCCTNFLANQRDAARALKRGGGRPLLSLDFPGARGVFLARPRRSGHPGGAVRACLGAHLAGNDFHAPGRRVRSDRQGGPVSLVEVVFDCGARGADLRRNSRLAGNDRVGGQESSAAAANPLWRSAPPTDGRHAGAPRPGRGRAAGAVHGNRPLKKEKVRHLLPGLLFILSDRDPQRSDRVR